MGCRLTWLLGCASLAGCVSAAGDFEDRRADVCSGRSPRERELISIALKYDPSRKGDCATVSSGWFPLKDLGLEPQLADKRYWVVKFTPVAKGDPLYSYIDQSNREVVETIEGDGFPPKQPEPQFLGSNL